MRECAWCGGDRGELEDHNGYWYHPACWAKVWVVCERALPAGRRSRRASS
jgi:hypothetical protein